MPSPVVRYNVDVCHDKPEEDALQLIKQIKPNWDQESVKVVKFTDGITNLLYGFHIGNKKQMVLLRIYGEGTDLFIDRHGEIATMMLLHSKGCAPDIHCQFNNGLAYSFIPGMVLDIQHVNDMRYARLIAKEMKRYHSITPQVDDCCKEFKYSESACLFPKIKKFLQLGPDSFDDEVKQKRFISAIPNKESLLKEIEFLQSRLECLGSPAVLCHNDLLCKNLVYKEEEDRVYFIDYEYADRNFEAYDIANHFCEFAGVDDVDYSRYPDKAFQLKWLQCYLECKNGTSDISQKDIETLYVQVNQFALASHYFWGLWALLQAKHSHIDFDFVEYACIRFGEYNARKSEFLALTLPE